MINSSLILPKYKKIVRSPFVQQFVPVVCSGIGKVRSITYRDITQTVIICGSPRSGTTWLAEIVQKITGYPFYDEPMQLSSIPNLTNQYNLTWRTYRHSHIKDQEFKRFLRKILSGSIVGYGIVKNNLKIFHKLLLGYPVIIKFVRANLFLPYLYTNFPYNKIILIIRNPYAIISSELSASLNYWRGVTHIAPFYQPLIDDYPEFAELPPVSHIEEFRAVHWCLEHSYLVKNMKHLQGVHIIKYEDLYRYPKRELKNLTDYLGIEWQDRYLEFVKVKSKSVQDSSALLENKDPTKNYLRVLDKEQLKRIDKVLNYFNYPFYDPTEL